MKKILFIGDSITDAGHHISLIDTYLKTNPCLGTYQLDNVGLSSENTSGLTEEGHPGARPNIHERIDRILGYYNSDIAIIMYGINDAIYSPYDKDRFLAYQNGIVSLVRKIKDCGMKVYLCTPTIFDPISCKSKMFDHQEGICENGNLYKNYNDVMTLYADWIRTNMANSVDKIIDINLAMNTHLSKRREQNPHYISGDGIHPSADMSAALAQAIIQECLGIQCDFCSLIHDKLFKKRFRLINYRNQLRHSYDKETIGHKSPWHALHMPKDKLDKVLPKLSHKIKMLCQTAIVPKQLKWAKGYEYERLTFQGYEAVVICPKSTKSGKDWLWRTEFLGAYPTCDINALRRGYHLVYINIIDNYGCDKALSTMKEFSDMIVKRFNLSRFCTFLGLSRGGLSAVNFAYKYTSHVRGIILDAPVVDIRSWPQGKLNSKGSPSDYEKLKLAYENNLPNEELYLKELYHKLSNIAEHKIPMAITSNTLDEVVPYLENGILIEQAYSTIAPQLFLSQLCVGKGHHHQSDLIVNSLDFIDTVAK